MKKTRSIVIANFIQLFYFCFTTLILPGGTQKHTANYLGNSSRNYWNIGRINLLNWWGLTVQHKLALSSRGGRERTQRNKLINKTRKLFLINHNPAYVYHAKTRQPLNKKTLSKLKTTKVERHNVYGQRNYNVQLHYGIMPLSKFE